MAIPARHTRRLETWLWTGPLGHLVGGTLDFAEVLARYARFRLAARTQHKVAGADNPSSLTLLHDANRRAAP